MEHPTRVEAPAAIAGFWRRIFASFIDSLILGAFGWACTYQFADRLIAFGSNARLFGVAVALLYFGILNSRLGGGASLGKRILGLRVVKRSGQHISLGRSFWRAIFYVVPLYLNGWMFSLPPLTKIQQIAFTTVDMTLVFGFLLANIYLYIANISTRQMLHDLIAGTFVVKADGAAVASRTAGVHLAIVGVWFALLVVGIPLGWNSLTHFAASNPFGIDYAGQTKVYDAVMTEPGVRAANVQTAFFTSWVNGQKQTTTSLTVLAQLDHAISEADGKKVALRISTRVLKVSPDILGQQKLSVTVRYGYDVGIWSYWQKYTWTDTPADWKVAAGQTAASKKK